MMNSHIEKMNEQLIAAEERYDVLRARFYVCDQFLGELEYNWAKKPEHMAEPDTPYDRAEDMKQNCEKMDMAIRITLDTVPDVIDKLEQIAGHMREYRIDECGFVTGQPIGDEELAAAVEDCAVQLAHTVGAACERMIDRYETEIDMLATWLKDGR